MALMILTNYRESDTFLCDKITRMDMRIADHFCFRNNRSSLCVIRCCRHTYNSGPAADPSKRGPSPPFRGEREGPVAERWEGEVGSAGALESPTSPLPSPPMDHGGRRGSRLALSR